MNSIVISINVDINEKRNEILSEKSSFTKMKNLLADQLFFELSAAISAEVSPTSDLLAVRIALAKPASVILRHSPRRAVGAALKNIDLLVPANFISQSVRVTPDSDPQAVGVTPPACRSCDQS